MYINKIIFACLVVTASCSAVASQVSVSASSLETDASANGEMTKADTLIQKGFSFLGIKYRYGGNGPEDGGFDCSGLVRKVFSDALGLNLPRTAAAMARLGSKVGREDLKPGDLVFFNTMRRSFSHVGIYIGDNKFLNAPSTGKRVRVDHLDNRYWAKRFVGGRRLVAGDSAYLEPKVHDLMSDPAVIEALRSVAARNGRVLSSPVATQMAAQQTQTAQQVPYTITIPLPLETTDHSVDADRLCRLFGWCAQSRQSLAKLGSPTGGMSFASGSPTTAVAEYLSSAISHPLPHASQLAQFNALCSPPNWCEHSSFYAKHRLLPASSFAAMLQSSYSLPQCRQGDVPVEMNS